MEDNIQEKDDIAKVTSNNTIDNIKWDKVVFWCTVGLGVLTPLAFLRRYDILTVFVIFGVLGLLYGQIDLLHSEKVLYITVTDFFYLLFWILYYMSNWNVTFPYEQAGGTTLRKFTVFFSFIEMVLLLGLSFGLKKCIDDGNLIETKIIKEIEAPTTLRAVPEVTHRGQTNKPKSMRKSYAPKTSDGKISMRELNEEAEP